MLCVVAGTGTEIGKTWVACELARSLRADGWTVSAHKPAQSFEASPAGDPLAPTDAELLAAAVGADTAAVCPPHRWYPVALAPPMAADALGRDRFSVADLVAEIEALRLQPRPDVELVELAGGPRSPMAFPADDGDDGVALTAGLGDPAVVLVADAGLGTVDAVRRSVPLFAGPVCVVLNRFDAADDLHRRNRSWLVEVDGFDVETDATGTARWLTARLPVYCGTCGQASCDGSCAARPGAALDPDRFCVRCGRKMAVRITPGSVAARCPQHGPVRQ